MQWSCAQIPPNDCAKSEGTITHLHAWWPTWPLPHSFNTGVKKRPDSHFKFLGLNSQPSDHKTFSLLQVSTKVGLLQIIQSSRPIPYIYQTYYTDLKSSCEAQQYTTPQYLILKHYKYEYHFTQFYLLLESKSIHFLSRLRITLFTIRLTPLSCSFHFFSCCIHTPTVTNASMTLHCLKMTCRGTLWDVFTWGWITSFQDSSITETWLRERSYSSTMQLMGPV